MTELDLLLLYALVAFFCVIVNGMLLNRTLATKYKESIDNSYCLLLLFFIAFSLVDGIWGLFASPLVLNSYYGYWIATYGFHFMASWSAFIWSGYLVAYLRPKKSVRTALQTVRWLLISALMAIWGSNFFTHGVFVITEEVVYVTKPLRKILFYLQFSYYVIFTLYILISLLTVREKKHRKRYFSAMVFSSIPLLTGIFQLIWPDGPMYSMGFMLAAVTVYSFNITASREKYMEKSFEQENSKFMSLVAGLSEDFIYLILVDMNTDRYEMYCRGKNDGKLIEKLHSGSDFFTDRDMGFSYVSLCEEDLLLARNSLSRENIAAELTEKKSFSFAYRVRTESGTRYNLCKVIRSGSGNRVIIGLFDDDERIRLEMERQEQLEAAVEAAESLNKAKNQFFFNM